MSRRRTDEVIAEAEVVTIGELVRLSGMRYSTLKYYSEIGLLPFAQEEEGLTRRYRREPALQRLEEISRLRNEGLSLSEIGEHFASLT
jgi:DNA-binding transcriptional MerR regulator